MAETKRKLIDLTGQVFGRLIVVDEAPSTFYTFRRGGRSMRQRRRWWNCRCRCGNLTTVTHGNLTAAKRPVLSCGCYRNDQIQQANTVHGKRHTVLYRIWTDIRSRCRNAAVKGYKDYGGRGITICERWLVGEDGKHPFVCFAQDMGERPSSKHSVERVDNDQGYSPDNCVWALAIPQANNKRSNHCLTFAGETLTVRQWGRRLNVSPNSIQTRLSRGWSTERTLTTPLPPLTP